jgi:predicted NBD/HSP70 family sugar kinase
VAHLGSNLSHVQAFNRRIVLDAIRLHGPLSRSDVARLTELSPQTISNIVADLLERDLVTVTGQRQREGGGKPASLLTINPTGGFSIGINVYLNELSGVLIDLKGEVHRHIRRSVDLAHPDALAPLVAEVTAFLLAARAPGAAPLLGVGVGLPGPLNVAQGAKRPDYSAWHRPEVVAALHTHLDLPLFLENNANAAAIGECWYGRGRAIRNFVYVSLGKYLGGAVIIEGQLHQGSGGFAGEFGDMPLLTDTEDGSDLADVVSPAALFDALATKRDGNTDPTDLEALYRSGDPIVRRWLDAAAHHLAPILVVTEYLVDPEAIIVGGRLPIPYLDDLVANLERLMGGYRKPTKPYRPTLIRSDAGELAGALGAATLPIYDVLAPYPSGLVKQTVGS